MKFDLPKDASSIIKVIGVGGGGSNAVNHMFRQGIKGVDFMICNTDQQALDTSPVPHKIALGASLTEGRGAGSLPEVGKNAALEDIEDIRTLLEAGTKMVFVTAGMGGGTGTGAAPVIAQVARELGILTVGIVTMPFFFEGRKRRQQAEEGINAIRQAVDTLLVINNDKLREMYGNLSLADAFAQADNVLTTAAKGIAEIITRTGYINVDFEDVRTVMKDSGVAIMGSAAAGGENRAMVAVERALASPLLNDNDIQGARYVLLNITFGNQEVLMDEISDITDYIQDEAGSTADVIWGYGVDEELGDEISVTIIATGFQSKQSADFEWEKRPEKKVMKLEDEVPSSVANPHQPVVEQPAAPAPDPHEPYLKPVQDTPQEEKPAETQGAIPFEMSSPATPPTPKPEPTPAPTPEPPAHTPEPETHSFEPYLKSSGPVESTPEQPPAAKPEPAPVPQEKPVAQAPATPQPAPAPTPSVSPEDQQKRAGERIMRLKDLSSKLRTPSGLSDMENEPAYKRRQVRLDDVPHSSESQVSRYTLTEEELENGDKQTGLKPNNSFLHDNVD
ncbi:MAG: cell division protein FtsZ [Salibacteraceae bacterium]